MAKKAKKKASPKQLAARAKFIQMVKSGKFKKARKIKKASKKK
jgi:hypothetical protein